MKAFITTVDAIFHNTISEEYWDKTKALKIPMHQREYLWEQKNISDLIGDIQIRDKFIGMIILDEKDNCYEIVDGQQRLTTIYLSLAIVFNRYKGSQKEQQVIRNYLCQGEELRLQNESVGKYLSIEDNEASLKFDSESDIYKQENTFTDAFAEINDLISEGKHKEFKEKLLTCTVLVLVRNSNSEDREAIEQVFLDINEKAKRLDHASIFKGYCFKNYDESYHAELKNLWIRLKKIYTKFHTFSEKDYCLDDYIYTYLLLEVNGNMPKDLSPGGRHFLEDKDMDQTEEILSKMINYGEAVCCFEESINDNQYLFEDICDDYKSYKTGSEHLITNIKKYLNAVIEYKSAQYQKLPLFYLVYSLRNNSQWNKALKMNEFMAISSNLYIYAMLFTTSSSKKSKSRIDHTIHDILEISESNVGDLINASKELREGLVSEFTMPGNISSFDSLSNLYTLMDLYNHEKRRFDKTYINQGEQVFTIEHFIIPDGKNGKIIWSVDDGTEIPLYLHHADMKKRTINYLIVEKKLNNDILLDKDIITKITLIKDYYKGVLPKHISLFVEEIEKMPTYKALQKIKGSHDEDHVKDVYLTFINDYFSEEHQSHMLSTITDSMKNSL